MRYLCSHSLTWDSHLEEVDLDGVGRGHKQDDTKPYELGEGQAGGQEAVPVSKMGVTNRLAFVWPTGTDEGVYHACTGPWGWRVKYHQYP
jgi:hypothetical protein